MATGFALFDTALGRCGIVWNGLAVAGVYFPERDPARTVARIARRFAEAREDAPPEEVRHAMDGVVALLAGEARDLSDVRVDLGDAPEFRRRVYAVVRTIPPGGTLSYGEIARRLGPPVEARDVGEAMGRNPVPIIVPCHRVVGAGGKLGGFSAPGGSLTKRKLLAIEAVHATDEATLFSPASAR